MSEFCGVFRREGLGAELLAAWPQATTLLSARGAGSVETFEAPELRLDAERFSVLR